MMSLPKTFVIHAIGAMLAVSSGHAAVFSVPDYSLSPDGTTASPFQSYNITANNGGSPILSTSGDVVYFITTFTWAANTNADLVVNFAASAGQDRLGVRINNTGALDTYGDGNTPISSNPDYNFGAQMDGQTVILIAKLQYDLTNNVTYGSGNASDDTLMNVWVNPTISSVEGSGTSAGDQWTLWNSAGYHQFEQRIFNNSTPGTSGASFITNTTILSGADATFENALLYAGVVPEPSSLALLSLGGLMFLRRRRN